MDKFRKWLNKPKADDKSLLARFFHADRALIAVASELDSFDGRAEPDRCSRLVSRLRQGQDKVLSITNQIMEELLGEDRAARAFRAKFPEEVLQENLAGQLWFGAECLAAGSSIMNREMESTAMRPLAQAVTKSLDNVRNLLRDQCLRNNVPNSQTLPLDFNNSTTEQLYESLKIFDRLFAEFELRYVSAMVQVKTKHEYEMQEFICVLFSETLQRALLLGLLEQDQVDAFDPALMFSIPRLAIISGLVIYSKGPLNMDMPADQLSDMFRPFRTILIKIRDLLRTLNKNELFQLEKLLCTNEDIHLQVLNVNNNNSVNNNMNNNNNNCDDINDNVNEIEKNCISPSSLSNETTASDDKIVCNGNLNRNIRTTIETTTSSTTIHTSDDYNGYISSSDSSPSSSPPIPSSSSASSSAVDTLSDWTDDESIGKKIGKEENLVQGDCATGFLIPNTNFGNLLQTNEAPLTENFIASDDEDFCSSSGADLPQHILNNNNPIDSEFNTNNDNTGSDRTPDSGCFNSSCPNNSSSGQIYSSYNNNNDNYETSMTAATTVVVTPNRPSCSRIHISTSGSGESEQLLTLHATPTFDNIDTTKSCLTKLERQQSSRRSSRSSSNHRYHHHQNSHHHHHHHNNNYNKNNNNNNDNNNPSLHNSNHNGTNCTSSSSNNSNNSRHHSKKRSKNSLQQKDYQQQPNQTVHIRSKLRDTSGEDTSSSVFDGESQQTTTVSLKATGRTKFKSTENLLHRLFVCIAGVADQLQTNFASDLRQILRSVFLMNMSPAQEDIKIPEKTKESELFEFRASENDVIQESAGSNQSIYSAEEVNPELDNVFASNERSSVIQRGGSVDSSTMPPSTNRLTMGRSRSLGEENSTTSATTNNIVRLRSGPTNNKFLSERRSSQGSNSSENQSPINSSADNSPVSGRSSNYYTDETAVNNIRSRSNSNTAATNVQTQTPTPSSSPPTTNYNSSSQIRMLPPTWIPDEEASRCMACTIPFTAFRRRHHCRNCGGVFCGGCSNSSAPLPKYGLTKAVRVCRECYVREVVVV